VFKWLAAGTATAVVAVPLALLFFGRCDRHPEHRSHQLGGWPVGGGGGRCPACVPDFVPGCGADVPGPAVGRAGGIFTVERDGAAGSGVCGLEALPP
jgi:hypothetical protein